jgi:1,2-phenylacetyl-CoA epoxidase catalytic subunit
MDGKEFVTGLVAEMSTLFARLGERETLESESEGQVELVTLLRLALASELEASELAAYWMPTTPEIDVKLLLAEQCGDEMKHYALICHRLEELGEPHTGEAPAEGYSPLYHYLRGLRTTVERVAAGPFAREAIAEVRNAQFVAFCDAVGDEVTARLYRETIGPEEVKHHQHARELLERLCDTPELQELAGAAVRTTLAIADELRTLAEKSTGRHHPIPVS